MPSAGRDPPRLISPSTGGGLRCRQGSAILLSAIDEGTEPQTSAHPRAVGRDGGDSACEAGTTVPGLELSRGGCHAPPPLTRSVRHLSTILQTYINVNSP